jgi:hypothetical protein
MTVQYQGVWTLQNAAQLQSTQRWVTDPLYKNTTLLLQADDAANGAQNNTFLDSSSNSFAITRNGNTTQGSFTPFSATGWSTFFDGSGDSFSVSTSTVLDLNGAIDFTIEAWVYLTGYGSTSDMSLNIANKFTGAGGLGYTYGIFGGGANQGKIQFYGAAGSVSIISTNVIPLNSWNHVAIVKSGTTYTHYLNGVANGSQTTATTLTASANALVIGDYGYSDDFLGYMSNLRITKNGAVYTSGFTPPTSPLTTSVSAGTVSLLTFQSNRFVDNSSNGFTLTPSGTPSVQAFSPFAPQFQWTPSVIGGSGYFDGTTDMLETPSITIGTNNFCFECWLYPTAGQGATTGIFTANTNNGLQLSYFGTTGLGIAQKGVVFQINGTGIPIVNAWNHVAFVRSGTGTNQTSIFLNGARIANGTVSYSYAASLYQLSTTNAGGTVFQGYIAGARLTNGSTPYDATQSTITIPTTPPTAITNTSLLLNFTNAGIVDGTMKNNLETVGNAQVSTAVVKYGSGSMFFDGTGDYLTSYNVGGLFRLGTVYTVEMWFYTTTVAAGNAGLINFATTISGNTGLNLYRSSAEILCNDGATGGTGPSSGAGSVVANVWTHLAVVSNGVTTKVYLNGVERGSYTGTTGSANNMLYVTIGSFNDKSSPFSGYIDDLRVTTGIARYTQNFIPPSVALPRQ